MLSLWLQSHFLDLCSPSIYIGALETNAWGGVGRKCIPVWRGSSPTRALSQLNFGSNPNPTAWLSHSPSPIWKFPSKEPSKGRPEKSWDFVPSWGRVYDPMPNSIFKSMAFKSTKRQNAFHFLYFSIVSMCKKSYRCHLCGSSASGRAIWVLNFRNWKPSGLQHLLQNAPCLPKLCENHTMGIRLPIQIVEASAQHLLLYWVEQNFVPIKD